MLETGFSLDLGLGFLDQPRSAASCNLIDMKHHYDILKQKCNNVNKEKEIVQFHFVRSCHGLLRESLMLQKQISYFVALQTFHCEISLLLIKAFI